MIILWLIFPLITCRHLAQVVPVKTVESAPFSKKDICVHVNLATEEKYVKVGEISCEISFQRRTFTAA